MTEPRPARAADRARAFRVGLLALVSMGILVAILVVTGPLKIVRGETIDVDFAFAGPIKPGASVRLSGVEVGAVQDVVLLAGQDRAAGPDKMVRVRARIEERAMPVVTDRARFRVTTLGVLGEHYLDLEPVPGGARLADGARIDGISQDRPDLLLSRASGLLGKFEELLPKSQEAIELMRSLSALMRRLDSLLAHDDVPGGDDLRAFTDDLRALVHGAAVGVGDGRALRGTFDRLPGVLDATAKLESDQVPALLAEGKDAIARVDKALDLLDKQPALADPHKQAQLLANVTQAMRSLDAVMKRADRLLGAVEDKRGGAGKLFWDEEAASDLHAVLKGLREDPVKFLLNRRSKEH